MGEFWLLLILGALLILGVADWAMWSILYYDDLESKVRTRWEEKGKSGEYVLYSMVIAVLSVLIMMFVYYLRS